jgi:nucleotide-binding universal stress UspA family protein
LAEEVRETLLREAHDYLEQVSHEEMPAGISLRTQTLLNVPAQATLSYAQTEHADLIVLCSHGYSGLKRWALGSVAQKIAYHSLVPYRGPARKAFGIPAFPT